MAFTVVVAATVAYFAVQSQLRGEIDDSLRRAAGIADRLTSSSRPIPSPPPGLTAQPTLGGPQLTGAIVSSGGRIVSSLGSSGEIPADPVYERVAAGAQDPLFLDKDVDGDHLRLYVRQISGDRAAVVARTVNETDDVLASLRLLFAAIALIGTLGAALLGRAIAGAAVGPISRLEDAAAHVGATNDLSRRIEESGPAETRSLARQFNTMLDALQRSSLALEDSVATQRQLIADASHELRTPLTSLRTNIEVLRATDAMAPAEQRALQSDVEAQLEDFGAVIEDVIELARGDAPSHANELEPVELHGLVSEAVERARVHWPDVEFALETERSGIQGDPQRLHRAVRNLLDNAAKWSPPGATVEVSVGQGEITVRDHGPGIAPDDLPHIFDRFYRGHQNDHPGSGLGLAIVSQVAEAHGGRATAANASGGGAELRLHLPTEASSRSYAATAL